MRDDPAPSGKSGTEEPPGRLRPTIIRQMDRTRRASSSQNVNAQSGEVGTGGTKPAVLAVEHPQSGKPGRVITAPTAIPGVERKRIVVVSADIERLSPGVAPAVSGKAVRLVMSFVPEGARDRQVTMWGHAAQQDYAELVSTTLELSQAEVLIRARRYLVRIADLLDTIDLEAVCGSGLSPGLFGRLFGGGRVDTAGKLEAARVELEQLVRLTNVTLEPLLALKASFDEQSRRLDAAWQDIEAAGLAAAFLSDHLVNDRPELSRRLLERSMSLAQTALQIRNSASLRDSQAEQPLSLVAAIQNVVLVTLPGWLVAIAALNVASPASRQPTPTQAAELQFQLCNILQQLKA